jgi:uncharacterized protein (DUF433 family)
MPEVLGFTIDQTARVTGLSQRQLRYWNKTGFFPPGFMGEKPGFGLSLYTFRDLVGLRALAELRKTQGISLQELRKTADGLAERHKTPWASLTLYVAEMRVYFDDPESGLLLAGRPGRQAAMRIEMKRIANDAQAEVERLRTRTLDEIGKVDQKRNIAQNEPVVAGTRIPTSAIWNLSEGGLKTASILREYPRLTVSDVHAALAYERKRRSKKAG